MKMILQKRTMNRKSFDALMAEAEELVNSKSIEFLADENWEKLDDSWKGYLEGSSLEDLVALLNSQDPPEAAPESLKLLKSRLTSLEYSRTCVKDPEELWRCWTGVKRDSDDLEKQFQVMTANGVIRKRIKAKKQHEIDRIVELIAQIQRFFGERGEPIDSLVDIGAGVGHLSRIISLKNKLAVMAVEGNQQFTLAANCLDEKLVQESARLGRNSNSERKEEMELDFANSPIRFTSFVTEELSSTIDTFSRQSAILVGLHCCGDFSSTILKVFRNSEKAKALVLLGCCYHKQFQCFHFLHPKTNENDEAEEKDLPNPICSVFPLSQKWAGCELSYVAREMACHNNENIQERFQNTDISRYARAHLEQWIWKITEDSEDRNIGMCSVKCEEGKTTFEEYIRKAMAKRGSHLLPKILETIPPTTLSTLVSTFRCPRFDAFDITRMLFAPCIESAILDDRVEYLRENGIRADVVPLFEATISPRNLAIVAYKV